MTARFALRAATTESHERLDELFSRFDLKTRAGYGDFLSAQAGAYLRVEAALEIAGAETVVADWADRRRSTALAADLAALGIHLPRPLPAPVPASEAAILGSVYVLEGSRLGGAMLLKSVPGTFPHTFLSAGQPGGWRAFVSLLDERLSTPASVETAADAAMSVFELFTSSAHAILGAPARS